MENISNQEEAQQQLASRLEHLARFNTLSEHWDNADDLFGDREVTNELGNPDEYGLSLEVEAISPRWGTTTYAWVLSTGGPHEEFDIQLDHAGNIERIIFVSLPWFDRITIVLTNEQREIVETFVNRFLYLEAKSIEVDA